MSHTVCRYCGGLLEVIKDAPAPHCGRSVCSECGRGAGYTPTPMEPAAVAGYTMGFGKHRGRTLAQIDAIDRPYLEWAAECLDKQRIRDVIGFYLSTAPVEATPP